MIIIAVLLLPVLGLLLYGMDRFEDRLFREPTAPRHARGRHLRLIVGGGRGAGKGAAGGRTALRAAGPVEPAARRAEAA
ncbi:hypothetical protein [Streptomyces minutiscleroticus]|uniref:hypothetical protein n=1 Tax=Streptomyces minutiscleroticus TaxID=68238 RepID=UPI003324F875